MGAVGRRMRQAPDAGAGIGGNGADGRGRTVEIDLHRGTILRRAAEGVRAADVAAQDRCRGRLGVDGERHRRRNSAYDIGIAYIVGGQLVAAVGEHRQLGVPVAGGIGAHFGQQSTAFVHPHPRPGARTGARQCDLRIVHRARVGNGRRQCRGDGIAGGAGDRGIAA